MTDRAPAAPATAVAPATLAAMAALFSTFANQEKARQEAAAGPQEKLDKTIPGGKYQGQDGRWHNADGIIIEEDGTPVEGAMQPSTVAQVAVDRVSSDAELDALAAAIERRKEILKQEREAREAGPMDAKPSAEKPQKANLPGDPDREPEAPDFGGMEKDELERKIAERNLTVKGSGPRGAVKKSDMVAALEKDWKARLRGG